MKAFQTWLQRGLQALDPWLDAVFPIVTALICSKQLLAAYSLLALYLALRLLQGSDKQAWRWILFSLLIVNAGLIIEDRDLKPGGPSDYLIVALSFGAGFHRTREQWTTSLGWMASCLIPLLIFSLKAGDQMIQLTSSFTGFNINKIGFLAGLLTVFAYSLARSSNQRSTQIAAWLLITAGVTESILTQSRAALAVPVIAIAADQLAKVKWNRKKAALALTAALVVCLGVAQLWYGGGDQSDRWNRVADENRLSTIRCWVENSTAKTEHLALGLGYGKVMQRRCGPETASGLSERDQPLAHAHNLYVQILGEAGLPGLLLAIGLTVQAMRLAWFPGSSSLPTFSKPLTVFLLLMAFGSTWQSMMLNQVLVGYSLAALSARGPDLSAEDAATPATPQTASAAPD